VKAPRPSDRWASGDAYEPYVGRWSRAVARQFVAWLGQHSQSRWLDVGCGTGALCSVILEAASPSAVVGVDPSSDYLAYARSRIPDARLRLAIGDAQALPITSRAFDAVVSGLALNFVPDPALALSEMARACRPGGIVGVYVWDYAEGMQLMRRFWDAAVALDSSARELDEGRRFADVCRPNALADLFARAGLRGVESTDVVTPTVFSDFDDYWTPFLGGQGPAPSYAMALSPDRREALRQRVYDRLPVEADGSIHLTARAWAVRGQR
jgi:SAM-dependent methyltransferase